MADLIIPRRHSGGKLTPEQRNEATRRFAAGESTKAIAAEYGVAAPVIIKNARRRGVVFPWRKPPRRYTVNEQAFAVMTPEVAYWIGFLMADGSVLDSGRLTLKLAEKDRGHIEKFRDFLGSSHPINITTRRTGYLPGSRACDLVIVSRVLCAALARFGIVPRKSTTGGCIGLENDRDFWRGVIDGDGGLYPRQDGLHQLFVCGATPLIEQYRSFIAPIVPKATAPVTPYGTISQCRIFTKNASAVVRHLYYDGCVSLDRKMAKVSHFV